MDWRKRVAGTFAGLAFSCAALSGCTSFPGTSFPGADSEFGFPVQPAVPAFADVVDQAEGADSDDPMRGRMVALDIGQRQPAELVAWYSERFPTDQGWQPGTADRDLGGGHLLCLVSTSADEYDEYLEIYRDTEDGPISVYLSRLYVSPERSERTVNRCGVALIWFPTA